MPIPRNKELTSQTSEPMTNSAPILRQASDGRTQVIPPSFSRFPSRLTGRRIPRSAQLALIAEASSPLMITVARLSGTAVVMAANGSFRSAKVVGKYLVQNRSSASPCRRQGQKILRARVAMSFQSMPAASIAPIRLPALVPVIRAGVTPASVRALTTPIWASARTEPPLRANPTRLERS